VRFLPVRVRLRVRTRHGGKEAIVKALISTGFLADSPDMAMPIPLAQSLGLWPMPSEVLKVSIETGGGVVEAYTVPQAITVQLVTEDRVSREVVANVLVNPYIDEVLVSDYLAEELQVQVLYPRRGLWKFVDEDRVRESE